MVRPRRSHGSPDRRPHQAHDDQLRTDGGEDEEEQDDLDRSNVDVTEAGTAEPAAPKWEKPDPDDIPEFEIRADEPVATGPTDADAGAADSGADPTAGMPNTARSPGQSRIKAEGIEGYIVALELCARLPEDIRLPEEAADLVPAAVEAELENDIRSFAASEFGTESPHVETLEFVDTADGIWLRLRLGISPGAFEDLDPDEIRAHAVEELEGLF